MADGTLSYSQTITTGAQRLDTIAGREYGDGRYWWIIAAASNIGWGLQVPPGTIIKIPQLDAVNQLTLIQ
jgi:nucleoid-associated protein YgaU